MTGCTYICVYIHKDELNVNQANHECIYLLNMNGSSYLRIFYMYDGATSIAYDKLIKMCMFLVKTSSDITQCNEYNVKQLWLEKILNSIC